MMLMRRQIVALNMSLDLSGSSLSIPRKKYTKKVKRLVKDEHGADVEEDVDVKIERDDDEMWELREQYNLDKSDYESARKLYLDAQKAWDDNRGRMYNLVLQHCSKELKVKLRALAEWLAVNAQRDIIKLLMMVRVITHQHDETRPSRARPPWLTRTSAS